MNRVKKFLLSIGTALVLVGGISKMGVWYLQLPIVQMTQDGTCVRVLAMDGEGYEVERECSTIELKKDKYHKEVVLSVAEQEKLLTAQAEERLLRSVAKWEKAGRPSLDKD